MNTHPFDPSGKARLSTPFLPILGLIAAVFLTADAQAAPVAKPNILVILSDDQGYADTGFQGCTDIPTPHLDRLAREGLRCTNAYVTHPYCSPSRAGLLTGRYQARFGHEHNPHYNPDDHREGLPLTETLLPELLGRAGYATGWVGKWHLGAATEFRPENRGFRETFGFIGGGHQFISWKVNPKQEYNVPICRDGKPVEVTEHLTLAFGHEAAAFVKRHADNPWFLYLAFNAPHSPNQPTPERLAKFANIPDKLRRSYAAQVSLMDDAIGETLDALRQTGQDRRTLVFFFSDNGGQTLNGACNTPLRGKKGDVFDGGIRVPFVVSWPGTLPEGKDYAQPIISMDVFATALACAGVTMPTDKPYDSVNVLPYLSGQQSSAPHDRLFWRRNEELSTAVRAGDKKLVRLDSRSDQLFDITADIGETHDLAASEAKTLAGLGADADAWIKQMAPKLAFPGDNSTEREWPQHRATQPAPTSDKLPKPTATQKAEP
ncbi:MAG: sulfatase-like hydrolase/transferase [Verrucomicrobiota bacterium]